MESIQFTLKNIFKKYSQLFLIVIFFLSGSTCDRNHRVSLYEPATGPFVVLVKSGKPKSLIIIPAEPTFVEEYAASELQKYFEGISGVKVPISRENGTGYNVYSIYIGKTRKLTEAGIRMDEEKMGRDGFEIKSLPDGLIIVGKNDLGTVFGIYELLERYFDVRWFMPEEEYYPINKTLKIGQINLIFKPSFIFREVYHGEWALHQRMNTSINVGDHSLGINMKWDAHTFSKLIPKEKYFTEHPEYFALLDGKRSVTDIPPINSTSPNNQLCTSNPEVIKEVAKNLIDTLDTHPGIDVITLNPNDGGGFCECENCRAMDEPGRDAISIFSRRFHNFNNEVAKIVKVKHPEVLIKVLAYSRYTRPPLDPDFKPEDNLLYQLCHIKFCHNHPLGSDMCIPGETYEPTDEFFPNQEFEKILNQWINLSSHLFVYEYYDIMGIRTANLPWPMIHTMHSDIPFYRDKGVENFYTQSVSPWHRNGLNYYVAAKLAWNADINVDALLDDYFDKFYGPAASPAKNYFLTMEKAMQEWNGCISYGLQGVDVNGVAGVGIRTTAPKIYTSSVMEILERNLLLAEKFSSSTEVSARRVAMIRRMHQETKEALAMIR